MNDAQLQHKQQDTSFTTVNQLLSQSQVNDTANMCLSEPHVSTNLFVFNSRKASKCFPTTVCSLYFQITLANRHPSQISMERLTEDL